MEEDLQNQIFLSFSPVFIKLSLTWNVVKTQRKSTQLKATLKQLALELDTVVTWNPSTHNKRYF